MPNMTPSPGYDNVPELGTSTSVLGGPGGPSNSQAQALLNRTEQLKNEVSTKATLTNTAPVAEPVGATQSLGSSSESARADHRHEMPGLATTAAPGFIELATQGETNSGTPGALAVTAETLAARLSTEAMAGLIEILTQAEIDAGTDDTRAVTALKLLSFLRNAANASATDTRRGTVELATPAEVLAGSDNTRAATSAGVNADAVSANTPLRGVRRDANGDFTARIITAALAGNADTVTKLLNARNIALSGDVSGNANFDGSANINIGVTVNDNSHAHDKTTVSSAGVADRLSNSDNGSAPHYACRAWVNFDGTGANGAKTIRGAGNVSSVVKNGTGDYTITFATAMVDANYSIGGQFADSSAGANGNLRIHATGGGPPTLMTTTQLRVALSLNPGSFDSTMVSIQIFR